MHVIGTFAIFPTSHYEFRFELTRRQIDRNVYDDFQWKICYFYNINLSI